MARDERGGGSVSVWMLLMVPVILVMAGLVFDGSRQISATQAAQDAAVAASRAGTTCRPVGWHVRRV